MCKKLFFVVNVPWFFISHRLPIAIAAKASGYEVHVVTSAGSELDAIRKKGLIVHEVPFTRSSVKLLEEAKILLALFKLYRKIKPDIVHHITIKPVLYGSLISLITKVPYTVNAISGLGFTFLATGFLAVLRRALVKFAYRIAFLKSNTVAIFQNPDDRDQFIQQGLVTRKQTFLIRGSGVDLSEYNVTDEPSGVPIIVLLARMLWDKGIGEFVAAARLLKEKGIIARFQLVGSIDKGNPKAIQKQQIDLWCKEGIIEWDGYINDVGKVISASNIVCLPSYREGLPRVLIEAAACGRAVVTTDVPGCNYAIQPEVSGVLVKVHDALSLADALIRLIKDDALRFKMGKAGRVFAEQEFTIQKVVNMHLDIYKAHKG